VTANVCKFDDGDRLMAAAVIMAWQGQLNPEISLHIVKVLEKEIELRCLGQGPAAASRLDSPVPGAWLLASAILLCSINRSFIFDRSWLDLCSHVVAVAADMHCKIIREFARSLQAVPMEAADAANER
jgi:hypothetical protein